MSVIGPFEWKSSSNSVPQKEWDHVCTIIGFTPVLNILQNQMALNAINTAPNPFTSNVTGLGTYFDQTAGAQYLMVFSGTKGYTGTLSSIPVVTFTDRTGGVTISSATRYSDTLNAIFVATGGGNAPIKSTSGAGNFANLGGSPPLANIVKTVNNFMFLANAPAAVGTSSRLYWSNVSDPETWVASNFVDVRKNDGYGITGLANIGTDLFVFKPTSISKFGTTTFTVSGSVTTLGPLETVNYYMGANNGYNICQMTDGRVAFLGSDGNLYIYDGNSFFNASSQKYPGPDLRVSFGGSSAILSDSVVFENPYEKCIYLYALGGQIGYGYNYVENFWFTSVTYDGGSGGATASIYSLINTLGQIAPRLILGSNNAIYISNLSSTADNTCTATMTIRLPYKRKEGIPRSIVFEVNKTGNYVRARAGIDVLPSVYGYTNANAAKGRYVVPVNFTQPSTQNPCEQNLIVELSVVGLSSGSYGDIYVSDGVQ